MNSRPVVFLVHDSVSIPLRSIIVELRLNTSLLDYTPVVFSPMKLCRAHTTWGINRKFIFVLGRQ